MVDLREEYLPVQAVLGTLPGGRERLFAAVQHEERVVLGLIDDGNRLVRVRLLAVDKVVLDERVRFDVGVRRRRRRAVVGEGNRLGKGFELRRGGCHRREAVVSRVGFVGGSEAGRKQCGRHGGSRWGDQSVDAKDSGVEVVAVDVLQEEPVESGRQNVQGCAIAGRSSDIRRKL